MGNCIAGLQEKVASAPTDKKAEAFLRDLIADVAKDCPIHALVHIGQCLVDIRKSELRDEAERN